MSESTKQSTDPRQTHRAGVVQMFRDIFASPKSGRRFVMWCGLGLGLTSALGAAVNHFAAVTNSETPTQKPAKNASTAPVTSSGGSNWWTPTIPSSDSQGASTVTVPKLPAVSAGKTPPASSKTAGTAGTAADQGLHFSAGGAFVLRDNLAPIGASLAQGTVDGPGFARTTAINDSSVRSSNSPKSGKHQEKTATGGSVVPSPGKVPTILAGATLQTASASTKGKLVAPSAGSVIAVDHSYQLGSGELFLNNGGGTLDFGSSQPTYAALGLTMSSTPLQVTELAGSDADLHFALAGTLTSAPTLSISSSPDFQPLAPIPEPATGGMLLCGVALLGLRRRREALRA